MFHSYDEIQMMIKYRLKGLEAFMAEQRLARVVRESRRPRFADAPAPARLETAEEAASHRLENRFTRASQQGGCIDS